MHVKIIYTILFFLFLSTPLAYGTFPQISNVSMQLSKNFSCPASTEKAKELLKEYIQRESSKEKLSDEQRLDYAILSNEEIIALEGEAYQKECEKIAESRAGNEHLDNYSIYKIGSHFLVVRIIRYNRAGRAEQKKRIMFTILYSDYTFVGIGGILDL